MSFWKPELDKECLNIYGETFFRFSRLYLVNLDM